MVDVIRELLYSLSQNSHDVSSLNGQYTVSFLTVGIEIYLVVRHMDASLIERDHNFFDFVLYSRMFKTI